MPQVRVRRLGLFLSALALVAVGPAAANASYIFDLNSLVGSPPPSPVQANDPPSYYLRVQLQDDTDGSGAFVLATFTSNLASTGAYANQRIDFVTLNLAGAITPITFDSPSGPATLGSVQVSADDYVLPGAGGTEKFDVKLNFDNSGDSLDGTDVFSVKLRGAGLTQNSFLATNGGGSLYAGAHVIGIGSSGQTSISVGTGGYTIDNIGPLAVSAPAPAGLLLALVGGTSVGGLALRRGRRTVG